MKKILILALALTFVFAFAMSAMAAQPFPAGQPTDGSATYSTTNAPNVNLVPGPNGSQPLTGPYTGVGAVGDKVARIHSGYTANTNACASCHATHTAVGNDLLQWEDSQKACEACHDGTLGVSTYNVVDGKIANTTHITWGGKFSNSTTANSKSMHTIDGTVELKDAPGGKWYASGDTTVWNSEFECVSCHTPHGAGGNARILNPDAAGSVKKYTSVTAESVGVNTYAFRVPTSQEWAVAVTAPYPKKLIVKVGTTTATFVPAGAVLPADADHYTVAVNNNRTEVTFGAAPVGTVVASEIYSGLKVNMTIDGYLTNAETVLYGRGFNNFCGACHVDYNTSNLYSSGGTFLAAQQKQDSSNNYLWLDAAGTIPYKVARHALDLESGTYTQAYRHTVGFDAGSYSDRKAQGLKFETMTVYKNTTNVPGTPATQVTTPVEVMSCITCHVSHGTDSDYYTAEKAMYNYDGYAGQEVFDTTNNGTTQNNRGSNLKRMPNMGVCETCHRKGVGALGHDANYTNSGF